MTDWKSKVSIKEKRTFVCQMKCDCGGNFMYVSDNAISDIFGSFFKSVETATLEYEHKCNKCGKIDKFTNMYPLHKEFEIGLTADANTIAQFVSAEFVKTMAADIEKIEGDNTK